MGGRHRPVEHWIELIRARGKTKHMEIVAWLKSEHGPGHGHADALVAHTLMADAAR
ncbi:protein of unknown function [Rhodococcus triatomae]|uniref:DUF4287 domain-containing protein n=1 Tax=Rhodococcus triatomae TaxID=300028 RepID=A0A1G7ZHQ3_9NOCA|nr:DUF4287 domain-containing protein [Rhodococcus triatomae]SDH08204.1 protein of unknown function [Rhodococcus triatomae]